MFLILHPKVRSIRDVARMGGALESAIARKAKKADKGKVIRKNGIAKKAIKTIIKKKGKKKK